MIDVEKKAQEVYDNGFCILEAIYTPLEIAEMRDLMDTYWEEQGSPPMENWGFGIAPLAQKVPELIQYFSHPDVVAVLKAVLRDEVHLVHAGARMSGAESAPAIGWHHHYAWEGYDEWDKNAIPTRPKIERVLGALYVDGSNAQSGPLVALPRGFQTPFQSPLGEMTDNWPGELKVEAPPGSMVVFDTTLWHTAHRGNTPGTRHLFGAHFQGWSDPRPHPEDNLCDGPQIEPFKEDNPILRGLLEPPAAS